jgi:hypothetical protein
MYALDPNIARQTPKPTRTEAAPQGDAKQKDHRSQNYQHLPDLRHRGKVAFAGAKGKSRDLSGMRVVRRGPSPVRRRSILASAEITCCRINHSVRSRREEIQVYSLGEHCHFFHASELPFGSAIARKSCRDIVRSQSSLRGVRERNKTVAYERIILRLRPLTQK